ncbi:cytochrome bd-I oxidase subunit CydX [Candidatus Hoaglandella endobia]|uniref:Cytochrome bd-I ubiquinol oxidase subunit X n=1 Tax=Candidatus Hoaglandella endobia TaxID=1778263 RepID=A0A143WTV4_9ENTR|nr:cytochrome bd-I oxidase subunit CydX [Candidatus Hoaglandella endobia]CUX97180.1 Cytochrome bd-I ubiquinol oxidase subunit X [Candidatus Hoaglandella endobia]
MWYFAWILGTMLACTGGIISALTIDFFEDTTVVNSAVTEQR